MVTHNAGNVATVSGRKLLKPVIIGISRTEVYSVAGEIGFGWWLVEHYLPYHVNRPNSCRLGEPARGRKDSPYFQVGYGSFYYIPEIWLIPLLNRLCQSSKGLPGLLLKGVSHPNPTYPLSAVICQGCIWPNKPVFLIAVMSWVDPGSGGEI